MNRITPSESLDRLSSAQQQGMALAPSKGKKKTPKFIRALNDNVYLFEQGKGGFITPAYEEITPLLGEYDDGGEMPPALQEWLEGYAAEMDWYANESLVEDEPQDEGAADEPRKDIKYMCKANWGQGAPYNADLDFGWGVCKTGCWATAVGIIMRYWASKGYHRGCMATTPYWYKRHQREFDPLPAKIVFDWRNIPDTKPTTSAQKKAVAELLKYIGMACKVNYGTDGTGVSATLAAPLLKDRLRMGSNIRNIEKTDAQMEQILYTELVEGRPVIIRGANSSNSGGHFFVADGYRAKDSKYRINWGWNGYYNGYYAWSALTPTQANDYTYYRVLTIGIQPDYYLGDVNGDGRVNITDVMVLLDKIQQGDTSIIGDVNSDGTINADDWMLIIDAILGKKML